MCECLSKIKEQFELPFEKPILIKDLQLSPGNWAIRLMHKTKSGNPTMSNSILVYFNYCPICGEKSDHTALQPTAQAADVDES